MREDLVGAVLFVVGAMVMVLGLWLYDTLTAKPVKPKPIAVNWRCTRSGSVWQCADNVDGRLVCPHCQDDVYGCGWVELFPYSGPPPSRWVPGWDRT